MVARAAWWILIGADMAAPAARQVDGATRARMLSALAGLVILGVAMMVLAWLGGRAVRRYMRTEPLKDRDAGPAGDAWARHALSPPDEPAQGTDRHDL